MGHVRPLKHGHHNLQVTPRPMIYSCLTAVFSADHLFDLISVHHCKNCTHTPGHQTPQLKGDFASAHANPPASSPTYSLCESFRGMETGTVRLSEISEVDVPSLIWLRDRNEGACHRKGTAQVETSWGGVGGLGRSHCLSWPSIQKYDNTNDIVCRIYNIVCWYTIS